MPETFDQILAPLIGKLSDEMDPDNAADFVQRTMRQVWNARGAADLETMGPIIAKLSDTMDPDHAREFVVDALRSLDR